MASSTANDVNIPVEESRACTTFKVAQFSHTWTINNFSFYQRQEVDLLPSMTLALRGEEEHDTTEWCLTLYPKGYNEECKEYLSFFIKLLAAKKSEVIARVTISVVDANGARRTLQLAQQPNKFAIDKPRGWIKFVEVNVLLDETRRLIRNDNLVLFCEIEILNGISKTLENHDVVRYTEAKSHLLSKIGQLFETKKFSDLTITACGKEFQAHKIVLAAQSHVFAAMFEHDTGVIQGKKRRKKESCINIIDIDDQVVKEMLHFLYTGTVNDIQKTAVGLLIAAEKYALGELKIMCEEALGASLTVENAADTLILAHLHRADQLKSRVMSFICYHATDVVTMVGFRVMIWSHPSLFEEVFCQMALKNNSNTHNASESDAAASKTNACATNTR